METKTGGGKGRGSELRRRPDETNTDTPNTRKIFAIVLRQDLSRTSTTSTNITPNTQTQASAYASIFTMKSSVFILLLAFEFGVALSFNSRLRGFCLRPSLSAPFRSKPNLSQTPSQRRPTTSLLSLSLPPDNDSSTSARIILQKRRAFVSNFVASSLLPVITSVNPASVSAWGIPNNENGPLVYGADDIMSPKDHGTTSMPVQENLRYGVRMFGSFYCRLPSITDDSHLHNSLSALFCT